MQRQSETFQSRDLGHFASIIARQNRFEMDNLKAFLSHEEIAMHLPESLPDVNDGDISNDDLDEDADSDETSSLMELQYTLQLLVPILAPLLQPPVLTASPYDDVIGLCYIDHYLNGTLQKHSDRIQNSANIKTSY